MTTRWSIHTHGNEERSRLQPPLGAGADRRFHERCSASGGKQALVPSFLESKWNRMTANFMLRDASRGLLATSHIGEG